MGSVEVHATPGYWKATGPNKFIGRGAQIADFGRGFSKGNVPNISGTKSDLFGKKSFG